MFGVLGGLTSENIHPLRNGPGGRIATYQANASPAYLHRPLKSTGSLFPDRSPATLVQQRDLIATGKSADIRLSIQPQVVPIRMVSANEAGPTESQGLHRRPA